MEQYHRSIYIARIFIITGLLRLLLTAKLLGSNGATIPGRRYGFHFTVNVIVCFLLPQS